CAAGVEVDPDAFCARFPAYQTSLRRLLEVHRELEANSDLLTRSDHWPECGQEFFGFRLEAELGRGAFARVFLAREPAVGNRQVVFRSSPHAAGEADPLGKPRPPTAPPTPSEKSAPAPGFAVVSMPSRGGTPLRPLIERPAAPAGLPK